MSTVLRADISKKNKYWITKERYYELKHFCLQYNDWVSQLNDISEYPTHKAEGSRSASYDSPIENLVIRRSILKNKIELVKLSAMEADLSLWRYILKGVTTNASFPYLQTVMGIPCSKDMYYDRYRKFFWILDRRKESL